MDLHTALSSPIGYSHTAGKGQAAQAALERVRREPPSEIPLGLRVLVSGRAQNLPTVPWIALVDPDVTSTAKDGLYLAYLYDRTLQRVYLSMNQGATQHLDQAKARGLKGKAAETAALDDIRAETEAMREALDPSMLAGTTPDIDLGADLYLPRGYEEGSVAAIQYPLTALPPTETLGHDLARFAAVYARCVELKDELAANQRIRTSARSEKKRVKPARVAVFRPKDASDYLANVVAITQKRSRRHEALVEAFGAAVLEHGHVPATNVHPRDLTVQAGSEHWLIEAKTVGPNAEMAVREAIGQLMAYRHFLYRVEGKGDPRLLALFSGPIGFALEELLTTLGIETVFRDGARWGGSMEGINLVRGGHRAS